MRRALCIYYYVSAHCAVGRYEYAYLLRSNGYAYVPPAGNFEKFHQTFWVHCRALLKRVVALCGTGYVEVTEKSRSETVFFLPARLALRRWLGIAGGCWPGGPAPAACQLDDYLTFLASIIADSMALSTSLLLKLSIQPLT